MQLASQDPRTSQWDALCNIVPVVVIVVFSQLPPVPGPYYYA